MDMGTWTWKHGHGDTGMETRTNETYVEVNGRKGILIKIKTGSGQGDPLSSILEILYKV
jgi:hypothetical protein